MAKEDISDIKNRLFNIELTFKEDCSKEDYKDFLDEYEALREASTRYCEARTNFRDTFLAILNTMTSRKKIYANKEITLRDNNIFFFNDTEKASLDYLFNNKNTFEDVCEYIKNDELEEKFRETRREVLKMESNNIGVFSRTLVERKLNAYDKEGTYYCAEIGDSKVYYKAVDNNIKLGIYPGRVPMGSIKNSLQNRHYVDNRTRGRVRIKHLSYRDKMGLIKSFEKYYSLVEKAKNDYNQVAGEYEDLEKKIKKKFKTEIALDSLF